MQFLVIRCPTTGRKYALANYSVALTMSYMFLLSVGCSRMCVCCSCIRSCRVIVIEQPVCCRGVPNSSFNIVATPAQSPSPRTGSSIIGIQHIYTSPHESRAVRTCGCCGCARTQTRANIYICITCHMAHASH